MGDSDNSALDKLVAILARESSPLRRRQILMGAPELWSSRTVIRFADETVRRMYVDIPQAERMARCEPWGTSWSASAGIRRR